MGDEADLTDENVDVANKDTITQGMKEDHGEFEDEELKYVCRLKGMDKIGYELDPERRQKTDKAEECESGCMSTDGCTEWSWYSNQYREEAMRLDCFYWAESDQVDQVENKFSSEHKVAYFTAPTLEFYLLPGPTWKR